MENHYPIKGTRVAIHRGIKLLLEDMVVSRMAGLWVLQVLDKLTGRIRQNITGERTVKVILQL
jgi:hypothetical protein